MHCSDAHLRLHISLNSRLSLVVKSVVGSSGILVKVLILEHGHFLRFLVDLGLELILSLRFLSFDSKSLKSLILVLLNRVYPFMNRCLRVKLVSVDQASSLLSSILIIAGLIQIWLERALLHEEHFLLALHLFAFCLLHISLVEQSVLDWNHHARVTCS